MPADFLAAGKVEWIIPSRVASSSNGEIERPDVCWKDAGFIRAVGKGAVGRAAIGSLGPDGRKRDQLTQRCGNEK